jgi:hypothetical protein
MDWLESDHVMCFLWVHVRATSILVSRISKLSSKGPEYSGKLKEYSKQAVSLRSTEEYKKSFEYFICVVVQ